MSNIDRAYNIIKDYKGSNNFIKYLKIQYKNKKLVLGEFETDYVLKNYNYTPIEVNKVVLITPELGGLLQDKYMLDFQPKKLLILKIIGEMGNSYHCYVQYRKSVLPQLMYINRKSIITNLFDVDSNSLDIDFDYYDNMPSNGGRKLKEHQKTGAKFLIANKKCILADSMGTGKMQDVDTIIDTPQGEMRFGDLSLGDNVYGMDGKPHKIIDLYYHFNKDLYEVEFTDGTKTNSGLEHLWVVKDNTNDENEYEVINLKEILHRGIRVGGKYRFQIPVAKPVEKNEYNFSVDPYKMGYSTISEENYRNIPIDYYKGSIEQRFDLFKGILDRFGTIIEENEEIVIDVQYKTLAEDICKLVRSLGGIAYLNIEKENNYQIIVIIDYFPFFRQTKPLTKTIKSVKFLKNGNAMCIKVDSIDETYLTNDYIVTHNTTTSIVAALAGGYKNILVITTASLKTNWKKDLILYEDENNINIVNGSNWTPGSKFTIINYDIVQNFYEVAMEPGYEIKNIYDDKGRVRQVHVPIMVKDKSTGEMVHKMVKSRKKSLIDECLKKSPLFLQKYDCVIIDEAQKLSNRTSGRYKAISDFLIKANPKAIFLLTGTPLTNNPMNLYNILKLINADITVDYRYYMMRYCGGKEHHRRDGGKYWTTEGATNVDELTERIKHIYIRRLASETGEMVNKTVLRRFYDLTADEKAQYDKLWDNYIKARELNGNNEEICCQLVENVLVRQFLAKAMTKYTIDFAEDIINNNEKLVIITCFQEEMDIIKKHFSKCCVVYNGSMSTKQKDEAQNKFMTDPKIKIFIGQIETCSVGLSLPVASKLVFNSYSWNETSNRQAEDRIYRLTQTKDVECIYMLFNDLKSQEMLSKVQYKGYLMDALIKSENEKNIK